MSTKTTTRTRKPASAPTPSGSVVVDAGLSELAYVVGRWATLSAEERRAIVLMLAALPDRRRAPSRSRLPIEPFLDSVGDLLCHAAECSDRQPAEA